MLTARRWRGLLHRRERVRPSGAPIPGTRSRARVEENAGGAGVHLTDEENARLEPLAAQVARDRYADMTFASAEREQQH